MSTLRLTLFTLLMLPWLTVAAEPVSLELDIDSQPQDISDAIKASLSLARSGDDPLLTEEIIRRQLQRGVEEIRLALQPLGFYQPSILPFLSHDASGWHASYQVVTGRPVTISEINVGIAGAGNDDPDMRAAVEQFELKSDEVLNHPRYEAAKAQLLRIARARGYFDAQFDQHQVLVSQQDFSARVLVHLASGPRYRFGEIRMRQEILSPDLLARYLSIRPGDPYDSAALLKLQQTLSDTGYFSNVGIRSNPEDARDLQVPIEVELTPRPPNRYSASIGYGTDTGPRAAIGYERRRLNTYGHSFLANYSISDVRNALSTSYRIPLAKPTTDYLAVTSDWIEESTSSAWYSTAIYGARVVRRQSDWQRSLALNLLREDYRVGDTEGRSELLIPTFGLVRATTKPRETLQLGWHLGITVKGAAQGVLSDTSFAQALVNTKLILPLGRRDRVILRGSAGASWINTFSQLPASQRFFTGGDYSVRGYAYNSLGMKDDQGRVVGGKNLLVGSIELEHALTPKLAAAVFTDTGNAFDDGHYTLYQGAGAGIRWRIPLGTLGLDAAQALSLPGQPWRLHLTVGSDL